MLILILASLFPVLLYAQTSVIINKPVSNPVNSPFGMRTLTGSPQKPHRGVDTLTPCGTAMNAGTSNVACDTRDINGYGLRGTASYGCGVTATFNHLQQCTNGSANMVSGGKAGAYGSGNSRGCHLHYEIRINGTSVDPQQAWGKNLCDPAVQKQLIDDAQQKLNGRAGGGGGSAPANNPRPPTTGTTQPPVGDSTPLPPSNETPTMPPVLTPTNEGDIVPTPDQPTDNEPTACDTPVWNAMVNMAVLQTRREMLMNERYIAKADSVMAYACFDQMYLGIGPKLGVFSQSTRWANAQVDVINGQVTTNVDMGPFSLDGAIVNAVDEALYRYLASNYNHDFLGGLLGPPGDPNAAPAQDNGQGEDSDEANQYGYVCGTMAEVWRQAKCMNVTDDPLFYKFEDLINYDPRAYPPNYTCNDTGITQEMIDVAHNDYVEFSDIVPHLEMIYRGGAAGDPGNGDDACLPPFPTGVKVSRRIGADRLTEVKTYDDALCITPGCSYQNEGYSGLGTCVTMAPTQSQAP